MPDGVHLYGSYLTATLGVYILLECIYSYILAKKNYSPLRKVVDYGNQISRDELKEVFLYPLSFMMWPGRNLTFNFTIQA